MAAKSSAVISSPIAIPNAADKTYVQLYDDVIVEGKDLYDGKVVQS